MVAIPETEFDKRAGRIDNWLNKDKVTAVQGYEDGTVTVYFDNGLSLKYGPFEDTYDEFVESLIK